MRGCLKRKGLERLRSRHLRAQSWEDVSGAIGKTTSGQGISEPRVARTSQARLAGPLRSRHLGAQSWEDVSGEIGQATSGQGISELRVARMPQAKGAGSPQVTAAPSPELGGCLRRNGPGHLRSRHLLAQSWEDVSSERGQTISGQGISEPRVARMSQERLAGLPQVTAFGSSELEGCLMRRSVLKGGEGSSVREAIVAHSQQHSTAQPNRTPVSTAAWGIKRTVSKAASGACQPSAGGGQVTFKRAGAVAGACGGAATYGATYGAVCGARMAQRIAHSGARIALRHPWNPGLRDVLASGALARFA